MTPLRVPVRNTPEPNPELSVRSHDWHSYRPVSDFLRSGVAGRAAGLGYLAHVVDVAGGGRVGSLERSACCAGPLRWTSIAFLQDCCVLGLRVSLVWRFGDRSGGSGRDLCDTMNGAREMPGVLVVRLAGYESCLGLGR